MTTFSRVATSKQPFGGIISKILTGNVDGVVGEILELVFLTFQQGSTPVFAGASIILMVTSSLPISS